MNHDSLEKLGYDEYFQEISAGFLQGGFLPARVIEVSRNSYMVSDGRHEMVAELSGKFLFNVENTTDYPTVGDWVTIQAMEDYTLAIVHSVMPRKTVLKRKEPGKRIDFQLIAANIDYGLIVQSADKVNFNLLDRYLVMLNESGIFPVVIISKIDLVSPSEIDAIKESLSRFSCQVLYVNNNAEGGVDDLKENIITGKTYCLLGQSGVGKSSLLNNLLEANLLKVGEVREKDGRGRHTTVRRQLVCLSSGSLLIDTPGIRELGNFQISQGLEQTFYDFSAYSHGCRFADCSHTHEQGCAVIAAVKEGEIAKDRYENFLKLRKESEFYDMSYQQRRSKDMSFGKMVKNYKKMRGKKGEYQ